VFWLARSQPKAEPSNVAAIVPQTGVVPETTAELASEPATSSTRAADVRLEIHCQRKGEDAIFHVLSPKDAPLTNGDKVQVHVSSNRPHYFYVYWYDPEGNSKRLWPDEPDSQQELTALDIPPQRDKWLRITGSHGNEIIVVGAADKPLEAAALAAIEKTPSFTADSPMVRGALMLPIAGTKRGIEDKAVSGRKSPLDVGFEDLLLTDFATYRGVVFPHK
jgi:hypothetical protein